MPIAEKVSFDGASRKITVNTGVVALDIRSDLYSAWVRWVETTPWATQAMRFSGADLIPNGETGLIFFLINGWKLIYNPNTTSINGVLYSEDYATAYWSLSDDPIYPATVSALVNTTISYQNVITGEALTATEIGQAVRDALALELSRLDTKVSSRATLAHVVAFGK